MANISEDKNFRAFFGRRLGRPLRMSRQRVIDELLPVLQVGEDQVTQVGDIAPSSLFSGDVSHVTMEIGFGSGEHVIGLLAQHPDHHFIAIEPFINGMSNFLKDIEPDKAAQARTRVYMDDALMVVRSLTDASIDRLYILNPDPWHKTKHHKRRIVRPETLDEYARIMKPGAELILTSDVPYLSEWMFTHTFNHDAFAWVAECAADWTQAPKDWIETRYAVKGAKGADRMSYLIFRRK